MTAVPSAHPWRTAGHGAAALAAGMGVGRFAYTPILPLMHAQAGLPARLGASLATANYVGYLVGAVAAIGVPALVRSRSTLRVSLLVLIGTLALMPVTTAGSVWLSLRLVAGVASALVFVTATTALLTGLHAHGNQLIGWALGGIGSGIALSGLLVLTLRVGGTWREAWWGAAALSIVFAVLAWPLRTNWPAGQATAGDQEDARGLPWFGALLTSYSLEGVGYIIAGTFLVAAIEQTAPGSAGSGAWVLVGLAALPSSALWAWLSRTWSRPTLLVAALLLQAIGIALPALAGGVAPALVSAALFGATFIGVSTIVLATGTHLRVPRAVAVLTTGYGAGQVLGPLAVNPFLHSGYHQALLLGAGLVALAAIAAGVLRHRFPHHLGPLPTRVQGNYHQQMEEEHVY